VEKQDSEPEPSPPSATSGELAAGAVFGGRYEVQRLVGQGPIGRVYAARDLELERVVAVKTLKRGHGQDGAVAVQRVMRELPRVRGIVHENVVRILDMGDADGIKFFTMEFIEGESLDVLLRARGRVPASEAVALARQILAALAAAHSRGAVHRDLKPQNVIVGLGGIAHVTDFGIGRPPGTEVVPVTGVSAGIPDYLSPEQVSGGQVGAASDLYSFGVILYEMLTGQLPFPAGSAEARATARLAARPRPPGEIVPGLPEQVAGVVMKCLEPDPRLRYETVADVLDDLDGKGAARATARRVVRAVRRRQRALGWTAAAVAVLALGVWIVRRPAAAVPPEGSLLAILPFTNVADDASLEWMRTGLPELLISDLSQSRLVRPVRGDRIARVLEETGLARQPRFDEAALETVAKRTRAGSALTGQFRQTGGRLQVDLTLEIIGSAAPVRLTVETAASDVFSLVDKMTRRVKERLGLRAERVRNEVDTPVYEVSTPSIDALRAYASGLAQLRNGASQEAAGLLERATRLDPGFAMACARLAEARMNLGRTSEAAAAGDRARMLSAKKALPTAEREEIQAVASLARGDHGAAARAYEALVALYPEDPDLRMDLGRAYENDGRIPDAIESYGRAVPLTLEPGAALLALGRAQAMAARPEAAIVSLRRALDTKKFDAQPEALATIHSILGVACRDTGRLEEALDHLGRSLEIRKAAGDTRGQIAALGDLASVHERRGEAEAALDLEGKAVALARDLGDADQESKALDSMASTYERTGRLDKALGTYRESLQIEKERRDDVAVANRLDRIANVYRLQGKYDDAVACLDQAKGQLGSSGDRREAASNLAITAQVRGAQGLYDQSIEAYLGSLPLFQETGQRASVAMVHRDLGRIYALQGRYAEAGASLDQSLETYSELRSPRDVAETRTALGRLLAAMGLLSEAEKELAQADRDAREAKAEDTLSEVLLGQAEVAHLRGDAAGAADLYERAGAEADREGRKAVAAESRIGLGLLHLEQGKRENAERVLARARRDAADAQLRPIEVRARAALADAQLAGKSWAAARREAQEAAAQAETLALKPVLWRAQFATARALEGLGRAREAVDAYARAASTLDSIRSALAPERAAAFTARPDAQAFARDALPRLEKGGRTTEANLLKEWVSVPPSPPASPAPPRSPGTGPV
jgi:eukaryotic-like serine/threonine-protein kinase